MPLRDTPAEAAWRWEVGAFIEAEAPTEYKDLHRPPVDSYGGGDALFRGWRRTVAARGWLAPHWPKKYGGLGLSVMEQFILKWQFILSGLSGLSGAPTCALRAVGASTGGLPASGNHMPLSLQHTTIPLAQDWERGWGEGRVGTRKGAVRGSGVSTMSVPRLCRRIGYVTAPCHARVARRD
jgi:alkylation response protein AidB-like acyl-CoA dehydrogenase